VSNGERLPEKRVQFLYSAVFLRLPLEVFYGSKDVQAYISRPKGYDRPNI
jgi:hypothetical protein